MKSILLLIGLTTLAAGVLAENGCKVLESDVRRLVDACIGHQRIVSSSEVIESAGISESMFGETRLWTIENTQRFDILINGAHANKNGTLQCAVEDRKFILVKSTYGASESLTWKRSGESALSLERVLTDVDNGQRKLYECIYVRIGERLVTRKLPNSSDSNPIDPLVFDLSW